MPDYEWFYTRFNDIKAVRFGKWKLVVGQTREDLPEPELYNLEQDIGEEHDVAGRHPDIVAKLRTAIAEFRKTLPEVDMPPRP